MARFALAKVIGDGTEDILPGQEATTGPYRPALHNFGAYTVLIVSRPDGHPRIAWCLARLTGGDYAAIDALPDVRLLPDWTLDHVLTAAQAAQVQNAADHFGISATVTAGMTVRQVLRWLRDQLDVTWTDIR